MMLDSARPMNGVEIESTSPRTHVVDPEGENMASRTNIVGLVVMIVLSAGAVPAQDTRSPAACNPLDKPETGMQGDVPMADQQSGRSAEGYNCGLAPLSEVSLSGTGVQGAGHCAYVRVNGGMTR